MESFVGCLVIAASLVILRFFATGEFLATGNLDVADLEGNAGLIPVGAAAVDLEDIAKIFPDVTGTDFKGITGIFPADAAADLDGTTGIFPGAVLERTIGPLPTTAAADGTGGRESFFFLFILSALLVLRSDLSLLLFSC